MKPLRRHLAPWVIGGLLFLGCLIPFLIWGEQFEGALSLEGARAWMGRFGSGAGLAGIGLLVADILLPIPSTVVMSALGLTYGIWLGGLYAATGTTLAGLIAYALSRALGRPIARRLAGEEGLRSGEELFQGGGAWLVAGSRCLPILPEAVACLAGLHQMPFKTYAFALACGSLPTGFLFAAIGALGRDEPGWAVALSVIAPIGLWLAARRWLAR
jgi:uncharacterized membrane protein YdjX (TVP38/TMEM64 family)